ncbi:MAG: hypothetical protein OHK93_006380 [Ramalina farinacea]|uniref:Uncharacterized protein n=1 Tax=Ramalina farinacea TaxID=258253 RepID=A0AA43TWP8_9LECA|nr:hypothetical protein [Ramalina farinacea]
MGLLLLTSISLTSSIPPPVQRQPTLPPPPLVFPTSAPQFLAVSPSAVPSDPYLITISRYTYQYFEHYSNPPLGTPSSLVSFLRKLREQLVTEASTHGGPTGTLAHLEFSRQQGGFVINFAVDQEGELMLTYDQLATVVAGLDDWRTTWGRRSKVMGCEFSYERTVQESPRMQVLAKGKWWASPAGTGTLGYGSGANVTLVGGGGTEGKPVVVETTRKRSRDALSEPISGMRTS